MHILQNLRATVLQFRSIASSGKGMEARYGIFRQHKPTTGVQDTNEGHRQNVGERKERSLEDSTIVRVDGSLQFKRKLHYPLF